MRQRLFLSLSYTSNNIYLFTTYYFTTMREILIYYIFAPIGALMYATFFAAAIYSVFVEFKNRNTRKQIIEEDDY